MFDIYAVPSRPAIGIPTPARLTRCLPYGKRGINSGQCLQSCCGLAVPVEMSRHEAKFNQQGFRPMCDVHENTMVHWYMVTDENQGSRSMRLAHTMRAVKMGLCSISCALNSMSLLWLASPMACMTHEVSRVVGPAFLSGLRALLCPGSVSTGSHGRIGCSHGRFQPASWFCSHVHRGPFRNAMKTPCLLGLNETISIHPKWREA